MKKALTTIAFGLAAGVAFTGVAAAQETLQQIRDRGQLICGSNTGLSGFGVPDAQGNWTGFDVEYCRALAVAIFDDPNAVSFIPLSAKDRFTALQAGEVDVLFRNSTSTMSRDTSLGLDFPAINYYDGQGFMVNASLGVTSALELDGASVCVQQGTTTELNLADFFRRNNMERNLAPQAGYTMAMKRARTYASGRSAIALLPYLPQATDRRLQRCSTRSWDHCTIRTQTLPRLPPCQPRTLPSDRQLAGCD